MKIPRDFERELFMFVISELQTDDVVQSSVDLAARCGAFCRRWYGVEVSESGFRLEPTMMLVAWSERLGKHVGDFYFHTKEG